MVKLVEEFGTRRWGLIGSKLNGRTGKQCRERWHNQLDPNINKDEWTEEEEQRLLDVRGLFDTLSYICLPHNSLILFNLLMPTLGSHHPGQ